MNTKNTTKSALMKQREQVIRDIVIIIFFAALSIMPLETFGSSGKDIVCMFSFCINGFTSVLGIINARRKHAVSVNLIYWIFTYFFMYFAPFIQYLLNKYPWNGRITDKEILQANAAILLFDLLLLVGQWMSKHVTLRKSGKRELPYFLSSTFQFSHQISIVMTLICCLLAGYVIYKVGFHGIVVSRSQATKVFYSGSNSSIKLVVESVIPAFMAYVTAEAAQKACNKSEKPLRFIILLLCILICFFPTAIPRYKMATIYGTVALVAFPQMRKRDRFFWIFVGALFFAFPMLNSFRREISAAKILSTFSNGVLSTYTNVDYDAYRMLVSSLRFVKNNGCTWGYQALGAFLFFVPRSVWPTKPVGSGSVLIRKEFGNDMFSNVSCPLVAEGCINFGLTGIALFGLFLGFFIQKTDDLYWKNNEDFKNAFSAYYFLVFQMFFLLRGDLLSGVAYTLAFVVTGFVLKKISKIQ